MSTTPVTPSATPAPKPTTAPTETVITKIETDFKWLYAHTLGIVIVCCLVYGLSFGIISLADRTIEKHDEKALAAQQAREGVDTKTQTALVTQLQQLQTQDSQRDAQYITTIGALIAQMKTQRAATAKQVTTDATLDTQAAAQRLSQQTQSSGVTTDATNIIMDLPTTRIVVSSLDQYTQAKRDVTNLQGQLTAQQSLTTDAKSQLTLANQAITGANQELLATVKADNDACSVKLDQQAAKLRKRGFWTTLAGFVGGILVGSRL